MKTTRTGPRPVFVVLHLNWAGVNAAIENSCSLLYIRGTLTLVSALIIRMKDISWLQKSKRGLCSIAISMHVTFNDWLK